MALRYAILPASTASDWAVEGTWSDESGGATGASVPTSADDVFVDALSVGGAGASLALSGTSNCLTINWTGATNTPTLAFGANALRVYGNITFIAAMVTTSSAGATLHAMALGVLLTTNGLTINAGVKLGASGATLTLQDNLNTGTFAVIINVVGTLDTNGRTVNCGVFYPYGTAVRTLTLGASTINCTDFTAEVDTNLTVTANTAVINVSTGAFRGGSIATWNVINMNGTWQPISGAFTCAELNINSTTGVHCSEWLLTATALNTGTSLVFVYNTTEDARTFAGGGHTYYHLKVAGTAAYALTITGNNTITKFEVDRSGAAKTIIATGTTQTVTAFVALMSGNKVLTLTGGTWAFTGSCQIVSLDWLSISNVTATPALTWYAGFHSIDGGGNTGVIFRSKPKQRRPICQL